MMISDVANPTSMSALEASALIDHVVDHGWCQKWVVAGGDEYRKSSDFA